jgi:hypothetical protein
MRISSTVFTLALAGILLTGCGDPKAKDVSAPGQTATPTQALQEIDFVRKDLAQATSQVHTGHRKAAEETVSETYAQHFEKVEPPLETVDPKLKEELEKGIGTQLRKDIRSGKPKAAIDKLVTRLDHGLATAQEELKK